MVNVLADNNSYLHDLRFIVRVLSDRLHADGGYLSLGCRFHNFQMGSQTAFIDLLCT